MLPSGSWPAASFPGAPLYGTPSPAFGTPPRPTLSPPPRPTVCPPHGSELVVLNMAGRFAPKKYSQKPKVSVSRFHRMKFFPPKLNRSQLLYPVFFCICPRYSTEKTVPKEYHFESGLGFFPGGLVLTASVALTLPPPGDPKKDIPTLPSVYVVPLRRPRGGPLPSGSRHPCPWAAACTLTHRTARCICPPHSDVPQSRSFGTAIKF